MEAAQAKQTVYEALREEIVSGSLAPGEPLSERGLVDTYRLSRTPVREILRTLEAEGLVEIYPYRGTFVRKLSPADIQDIFEVREALEGQAARLAAQRADMADIEGIIRGLEDGNSTVNPMGVHEFVVESSGNQLLIRTYRPLKKQLLLIRNMSRRITFGGGEESRKGHLRVMLALRERAPEEAERQMRRHLAEVQTALL